MIDLRNQSISQATLKPEDTIPKFLNIMLMCKHHKHDELKAEFDEALAASDDETLIYLSEEIQEYMQDLAPKGCYFGSHIGDGADLGFWEIEPEEVAGKAIVTQLKEHGFHFPTKYRIQVFHEEVSEAVIDILSYWNEQDLIYDPWGTLLAFMFDLGAWAHINNVQLDLDFQPGLGEVTVEDEHLNELFNKTTQPEREFLVHHMNAAYEILIAEGKDY